MKDQYLEANPLLSKKIESKRESSKNNKNFSFGKETKSVYNPSMFLNSDNTSDYEEKKKSYLALSRPITQNNLFDFNKDIENKSLPSSKGGNGSNSNILASCPPFVGSSGRKTGSASGTIQQPKSAYNSINGRLLSADPFKNNILSSSSLVQNNLFSKANNSLNMKNHTAQLNTAALNNISRPASSLEFCHEINKKLPVRINNVNSANLSRDINELLLRSEAEKHINDQKRLSSYLVSSPPNSSESINFANNILSQNNCQSSIEMIKSRASLLTSSSGSNMLCITPKYYNSTSQSNNNTQSGLGHLLQAAKALNSSEKKKLQDVFIPNIKAAGSTKRIKTKRHQTPAGSKKGNIIFQEMDNLEASFVDVSRFGKRKLTDNLENTRDSDFIHADCYRDLSYFHSDNDYNAKDKKWFARRMSILNFKKEGKKSLISFDKLAKMDMKKLSVESRFKRVNFTAGSSKEISQLKGIMIMTESISQPAKKAPKFEINILGKDPETKNMFKIESFYRKTLAKENLPIGASNSKNENFHLNGSDSDHTTLFAAAGKNVGKQPMPFQKLSFKAHIPNNIRPKPQKPISIKRRSKHGCWTCRLRKKKCSEEKDRCHNCMKLGLPCDYAEDKPEYMNNNKLKQEKQQELKNISTQFKAGLSKSQTLKHRAILESNTY